MYPSLSQKELFGLYGLICVTYIIKGTIVIRPQDCLFAFSPRIVLVRVEVLLQIGLQELH